MCGGGGHIGFQTRLNHRFNVGGAGARCEIRGLACEVLGQPRRATLRRDTSEPQLFKRVALRALPVRALQPGGVRRIACGQAIVVEFTLLLKGCPGGWAVLVQELATEGIGEVVKRLLDVLVRSSPALNHGGASLVGVAQRINVRKFGQDSLLDYLGG